MLARSQHRLALIAVALAFPGITSSDRSPGVLDPRLDPESHNEFFNKDLPDDRRPLQGHHFDHPYPHMQETDNFDKDYVKDENHDGGEWNAQSHYDSLRSQIDAQKLKVAEAKKSEEAAGEKLQIAKDVHGTASGAAAEAAERAELARADEKNASRKLDEMNGGASGDGTLHNATEGVDNANMTLEECRRQLEEAKNRIRQLKGTFKDKETQAKKALEERTAEVEKTKGELAAKIHDDEAGDAQKLTEAQEDYAGLHAKLEELQKAEETEKAEHRAALAASKAANATLVKAEADLKSATERLRAVRRVQANPGGGVVRSGASQPGALFLSTAIVSAVISAWFA